MKSDFRLERVGHLLEKVVQFNNENERHDTKKIWL